MTATWQPYREPLRATALRTVGIAVVVGVALSLSSRGRIPWSMGVLLVLWISLGGHFVELWFLNRLRPLLPATRGVQIAARFTTWFAGGVALSFAMLVSARLLTGSWPTRQFTWWIAGLAFIGVELVAHVALHLRGRPSIYDGQG